MNLFALLDQAAARFGDRGALYLGEQQRNTWSGLRDRVLRLATSIGQLGPPGARIAVASENCPEIVELMFAIWAAERLGRSRRSAQASSMSSGCARTAPVSERTAGLRPSRPFCLQVLLQRSMVPRV